MAQDAGSIYSEIRVKLDKLSGDVSSVKAHLDQIGTKSEQVSKKTSKSFIGAFTKTKLSGVATFALITKAIKDSIQIATAFEQSMANVQSVAGGTEEEFKKLEKAAMDAGESTRFTASQAADALYSLASAGMSATESVKALDGVLMLAGSTQSDLASTSATMVATLRQFNLESEEATRVSNVFAAAIGNSMANMDKLAASMRQAGPVASAMGLELEETVGALQALYDAGYQGEQAGTALKAILAAVASEADPTAKKLMDLGLTFEQINPAVNNMADIFGNLSEAGLEAGDVMNAFGARSGGQVLALMNAGRKGLEDYTKAVTDTNAAAEMYAVQNDTLAGSLDRLKSASESAKIKFANVLTPSIRGAVDALTGFITKIASSKIKADDLQGALDNLKQANSRYNKVLDASVGKTDTLTQAMVSQAKAARDLALQELASAYEDSNKQVEKFENTIKTSEKWLNKYEKSMAKVAKGTGYTADELNRMTESERTSIIATEKGINAADAYNIQFYASIGYAKDLNEAKTNLGQAQRTEAQFVVALTNAYLDEKVATLQLLRAYPELTAVVLNNAAAVEEDNRTTAEATKFMKQYKNATMEELKVARQNARQIDDLSVRKKVLAEITKMETDLHKANSDVIDEETEASEGNLTAAEKQTKIKEELNKQIVITREKEKLLGDQYDQNKELSTLYGNAINDLVAAGDTESQFLQDIIARYIKLNPIKEETTAADKKQADAIRALESSTANYGQKLEEVGQKEITLLNIQRNAEIVRAKASGASAEAIEDNITAINKYYDAMILFSEAQGLEEYQKRLAEVGKTSKELIEIERERALKTVAESGKSQDAINATTKAINEYYDALASQEGIDSFKKAASEIISAASDMASSISGLFSAIYDNKIDGIDRAMQAELEAAGLVEETAKEKAEAELEETQESNAKQLEDVQKRIDAATVAGDKASAKKLQNTKDELKLELDAIEKEKQGVVEKAAIEEKYAKQKARMEYEAAMWQWGISIAKAVADTAGAVIQALPNIPLSVTAGLIGGVQTATVIAQKPPAPKLATGGIILPSSDGTLTRQAENGYPELSINAGPSGEALMGMFAQQIVDKMSESASVDNNGQPLVVNLTVDRRVLSQIVVDDINNGRVRMNR